MLMNEERSVLINRRTRTRLVTGDKRSQGRERLSLSRDENRAVPAFKCESYLIVIRSLAAEVKRETAS